MYNLPLYIYFTKHFYKYLKLQTLANRFKYVVNNIKWFIVSKQYYYSCMRYGGTIIKNNIIYKAMANSLKMVIINYEQQKSWPGLEKKSF